MPLPTKDKPATQRVPSRRPPSTPTSSTSTTTSRRSSTASSATGPAKRPLSASSSSVSSRTGPTASPKPRSTLTSTVSSAAKSSSPMKTTSPLKSATTTKPTSTRTTAASTLRPKKTETILEEPESIAEETTSDVSSQPQHQDSAATADRRATSPRKLEIRRPQVHSDAEVDAKPKPKAANSARHQRTQSALIGGRPTSAPGASITEKQQSAREMEIMSTFLKESVARDQMAHELRDARAEIRNLERKNQTLAGNLRGFEEGSKIAPKVEAETKAMIERLKKEHRSEVGALNATVEALKSDGSGQIEALKSSHNVALGAIKEAHSTELEKVKASHKTAIDSMKESHTADMASLRSELEGQRDRHSKLAGVETKIQTVEAALSEHKQRASQNETELNQALMEKDADRLQLSTIISDLKREIDECQVRLDAEAAEQKQEKEAAERVLVEVRKELADRDADHKSLEDRHNEAMARLQKYEQEKDATSGHQQEINALKLEAKKKANGHAKQMSTLQARLKEIESASAEFQRQLEAERSQSKEATGQHDMKLADMQRLQQEAQDTHADLTRQLDTGKAETEAAHDQRTKALAEMEESLRNQIDALKAEHAAETEKLRQAAKLADDSRHEVGTEFEEFGAWIEGERRREQEAHEMALEESNQQIDELRAELRKMRDEQIEHIIEKGDGSSLTQSMVKNLQAQVSLLLRTRDADRRLIEAEYGKVIDDLREELRTQLPPDNGADKVVESLQDELRLTREAHSTAEKQSKEHAAYIEELKKEQSARSAVVKGKSDEVEQLRGTMDTEKERYEQLMKDLTDALSAKENISTELAEIKDTFRQNSERDEQSQLEMQQLEEQLGEIKVHHNRDLEEQAQRHEAAMKERVDELTAYHGRELKQRSDRHDALLKERVEEMTAVHSRELAERSQRHDAATKDQADGIAGSHSRELEEQLQHHEASAKKKVEELTAKHRREVEAQNLRHDTAVKEREDEVTAYHKQKLEEQSKQHEAALAALTAEHAEALREAKEAAMAPTPPAAQAETPLAYNSDEEPRRLLSAQNETKKSAFLTPDRRSDRQSQSRRISSAPLLRPVDGVDDPFAEPKSQSDSDNDMTIEGTLESIRIQTQQLLEINEDFLTESRRWSSKRRSGVGKASTVPAAA